MQQIDYFTRQADTTKIKYERLFKFLFDSNAPENSSSSSSVRCLPSTSKSAPGNGNGDHFEMNDESSSSDGSFNPFTKQ